MIREVIQTINGAGLYATISLVLFVCSFLLALLPALRMSKNEIEYAKRLPLDDIGSSADSAGQAGNQTDGLEYSHGRS